MFIPQGPWELEMSGVMPMIFDNTGNVRRLAQRGLPSIPQGNETFRFQVGDTVTCSDIGVYKKGTPIVIADRYMQHGYAYYKDTRGIVHRDKDLAS